MRSNQSEIAKPATPSFMNTSEHTNGHARAETPAATAPSSPTAVIGPKIRFKGELVGEEDLLIQGQIDGTIDLKGNNLTIGKQGIIKANVLAKTITVEGTVEGDIFGQERIAIRSSSNVKGNLVAERVTLEDGAKFRGSIDMDVEAHKAEFQKFSSTSTVSRPAPANGAGIASPATPKPEFTENKPL